MFQLAAYRNAAVAAGALAADLPAVNDQSLTIVNNHFVFQQPMRVVAAYGLGPSIIYGQINTPTLRAVALPFISPVERATVPPGLPALTVFRDNQPVVTAIDEVAFQTGNDLGSGTEVHVGILWLRDSMRQVTNGPIYTVRATSTITGVTGAWASGPMTLSQTMPAGRYQVVGMRVEGANLTAGRLVFPNQVMRPGVLGTANAGINSWSTFRFGNFGVFGEFESTAQPQLEILVSGANTAQVTYLDLIKVR